MAAKKEVKGVVKLVVPAKQANPAPPIGPALGADKTADKEPGMPIPCIITVYTDRSFEFIMKLPPVSYYIKKALKLKIGSHKPGRDFVGTITKDQIREIAENKMPDLNCSTIESAMNIVAGQCRSMGVKVEE